MILVIVCLSVVLLTEGWIKYVIGGCIIIVSGIYAFIGLDKRTNLREVLLNRLNCKIIE